MNEPLSPRADARTEALCPVCQGLGAPVSDRWDLVQCVACDHVWSEREVAESTNQMFEDHDYAQWRVDSPTQRQRQEDIAELRLSHLRGIVDRPGRALEVGCSTGEVVAALVNRGWDGYGIDLAAAAIDVGRSEHPDVPLAAAGSPTEAGFPANGYDLVMAFHVIEHVPDPRDFVTMLAGATASGGTLYLRMPNWESWSRKCFGDYWPSHVPEHLHHFSAASIRHLLSTSGFVDIATATHGQSRYWVGGARRVLSRSWNASEAMTPVNERSLRILGVADSVATPLLRAEVRFDRGGELVVTARRS